MDDEVVEVQTDTPAPDGARMPSNDALRDLVVKAYPDVVPELLRGETVDEMLASLPDAQAAYQRVAEQTARPAPGPVPVGGGTSRAYPVDLAAMSPGHKIRDGLKRQS